MAHIELKAPAANLTTSALPTGFKPSAYGMLEQAWKYAGNLKAVGTLAVGLATAGNALDTQAAIITMKDTLVPANGIELLDHNYDPADATQNRFGWSTVMGNDLILGMVTVRGTPIDSATGEPASAAAFADFSGWTVLVKPTSGSLPSFNLVISSPSISAQNGDHLGYGLFNVSALVDASNFKPSAGQEYGVTLVPNINSNSRTIFAVVSNDPITSGNSADYYQDGNTFGPMSGTTYNNIAARIDGASPVPEPSTYITGLGALGLFAFSAMRGKEKKQK